MRALTKGFTIIELMVSLSLLAVLMAVTYRLLDSQRRVYRAHLSRADLHQNIRTAAALLPQEFQQLDASDSMGSDLLAMGPSTVTYRRVRNTYFVCRDPDPSALSVTVAADDWIGLDPIDAQGQYYTLFAEGSSDTADDDAWLHVESVSQRWGTACPSGAPSITLDLAGITAAQLAGVMSGAPIQGFTVERVSAYRDGSGDWWLGSQRAQRSGSDWTAIQPLAGPLAPAGLQFSFVSGAGVVTGRTDEVALIEVSIVARTERPVPSPDGSVQYGTASVALRIALQNNRRR